MIRILLADSQVLTREGIVSILANIKGIRIVGLADDGDQLDKAISKYKPDVVVIDYHTRSDFNARLIKDIRDRFNSIPILILSNRQYKQEIAEFANHGIGNYVSKECGSEELVEAIYATAKGREFFCKCTLQTLSENKPVSDEVEKPGLTNRETEIIHLIAEGMTNKEIAEQLFLSFHTVKTHRKNIIKKLGFSFKNAGELTSLIRTSN